MPLTSLRIRLLTMLAGVIVTAAGAQLFTSFQASMLAANKLFDYHMEQMALALQDGEFEQLSGGMAGSQRFDLVVQLWNQTGSQVFQSRPHRALPEPAASGYSNVALANGDWRVYSIRTPERIIQIAQKMEARRQRSINIALQSLWPIWLGALLLLIASWWVVTLALKPLERVRAELKQRDGNTLDPVSEQGLPNEIAPLIHDMNALLQRVASALAGQQRFIADAAHELRSPLTALKLQVQLMARATDESQRQLAQERLAAGTERVIRLAEQLLQLARQESGEPVAPEPVDLRQCIEQVADELASFRAGKQIVLGIDLQPGIGIYAQPDAISVLLRNLLDNALRYTPDGGCVQIGSHCQTGRVSIVVADSGPGIAPHEYQRVFDRFYRIGGNHEAGSGLGLSIVRAIADRYHGTVELSRSTMGGLAVSVTFARA